MNNRKKERLFLDDILAYEDVFFKLEGEPPYRGRVQDINLGGVGLCIKTVNSDDIFYIENLSNFFLNLYLGDVQLLLGVKIVWFTLSKVGENYEYNCGVSIDIISPDDSLKLLNFVNKIRSKEF